MNPTSKNYKLFILIVLCLGCGTNRKHSFDSSSDNVTDFKPFDEIQIPGTKLFIRITGDFKAMPGGFRRDSSTYITVSAPEEVGIDKVAPGINVRFQQMHLDAYQGPLYYWTETEIGGMRSVIYYGKDSVKGRDKVWAFIGDHDHMYRVTAVFRSDDAATADTLNYCVHSLEEHFDAPFVLPDSIKYTLDLTNSGFWYDSNVKNVFYYTPSGDAHPATNLMTDQFFVITFRPINGTLPQLMQEVMHQFSRMNFNLPAYQINRKTVNGMDAYEVDCNATFQGQETSFYALLTGTPARPLMLGGWVYQGQNQEDRIAAIRQVAKTLKPKP